MDKIQSLKYCEIIRTDRYKGYDVYKTVVTVVTVLFAVTGKWYRAVLIIADCTINQLSIDISNVSVEPTLAKFPSKVACMSSVL